MTKIPPVIRPCSVDDLAAVHAIYRESVENAVASWELSPPGIDEMRRRYEEIVRGNWPWIVVELDGLVAGYAYAGPFKTRGGYRYTVESSIYVAPPAQGRGLGRALMETLIDVCTERGFRQMVAVIADTGNGSSVGLHRALGFRKVGALPALGYKFGEWRDLVLMQLALGEGDTTLPETDQ